MQQASEVLFYVLSMEYELSFIYLNLYVMSEQVEIMKYLYAAFGIVWIVFMAYILNLFRLRRALNNELKALESLKE